MSALKHLRQQASFQGLDMQTQNTLFIIDLTPPPARPMCVTGTRPPQPPTHPRVTPVPYIYKLVRVHEYKNIWEALSSRYLRVFRRIYLKKCDNLIFAEFASINSVKKFRTFINLSRRVRSRFYYTLFSLILKDI